MNHRRNDVKTLALSALISGLVLAACGGGSSAPMGAATTAPTGPAAATQAAAEASAAPAAGAAGPARKVTIGATNSLYSISTLEVKSGEKIEFVVTNNGDEKHNLVAVGQGVSLVSPDLDPGNTVSWTWTAPSTPITFKFVCAYHKDVPPIAVTVR